MNDSIIETREWLFAYLHCQLVIILIFALKIKHNYALFITMYWIINFCLQHRNEYQSNVEILRFIDKHSSILFHFKSYQQTWRKLKPNITLAFISDLTCIYLALIIWASNFDKFFLYNILDSLEYIVQQWRDLLKI